MHEHTLLALTCICIRAEGGREMTLSSEYSDVGVTQNGKEHLHNKNLDSSPTAKDNEV